MPHLRPPTDLAPARSHTAPEILRGESHYSEAIDSYSFGVLLFELATRREAYPPEVRASRRFVHDVCAGALRPAFSAEESARRPALVALAAWCWHADARCRPQFPFILGALRDVLAGALTTAAQFPALLAPPPALSGEAAGAGEGPGQTQGVENATTAATAVPDAADASSVLHGAVEPQRVGLEPPPPRPLEQLQPMQRQWTRADLLPSPLGVTRVGSSLQRVRGQSVERRARGQSVERRVVAQPVEQQQLQQQPQPEQPQQQPQPEQPQLEQPQPEQPQPEQPQPQPEQLQPQQQPMLSAEHRQPSVSPLLHSDSFSLLRSPQTRPRGRTRSGLHRTATIAHALAAAGPPDAARMGATPTPASPLGRGNDEIGNPDLSGGQHVEMKRQSLERVDLEH